MPMKYKHFTFCVFFCFVLLFVVSGAATLRPCVFLKHTLGSEFHQVELPYTRLCLYGCRCKLKLSKLTVIIGTFHDELTRRHFRTLGTRSARSATSDRKKKRLVKRLFMRNASGLLLAGQGFFFF